ncbi:Uma2 family endonuclease [Candidatus Poribacteria bacterium]|nr:Uma2 family endonuclease [Candidatus Poribacteria bacterium]
MSTESILTEPQPLILHFGSVMQKINDHEFFEFCRLNPDWRIERTSEGDLIIMPPTGGRTGKRNFTLTGLFGPWIEAEGTGIGFDSSTGFTLPNGAKRSPDLAWVKRSRWEALTEEEQEKFPPLCPDFVVELRSRSDALGTLQAKMQEYIANGAQLGWLIDPDEKKIYIYQPDAEVHCLENPETLSGDPVLPGLILDVQRLWS